MNRHVLLLFATGCIFGLSLGCGGGSKKANQTGSGQNVQSLTVNAGPTGNYANGAFTSVTLCVPNSSNCQTISGMLVDTGSVGVRVLSSALTLSLPQQNGTNGNPIVECLPFVSSYTWGPVQSADVHLAGETANSIPIQVLSDTAFPLASGCKNLGLPSIDTLQTLGANGILGVGLFLQDCGAACAQAGASNPGLYYACTSSGCQVVAEALAAQVPNPVAMFSTDNNGVLIELPAVNGAQASVTGSLIFGIGTQANNSLGSAKVYTTSAAADFTTQFGGNSYSASFLDSGSNGLFFLDSNATGIAICSDGSGFYCPAMTQNLSATNVGANGTSASINFSVANADSLFANPEDFAFSQLAGPNPGSFDWGLPFFFGRNVFTAIETRPTPQGAGPYWAY
jgi:Protein of unknown function (DUF3443)